MKRNSFRPTKTVKKQKSNLVASNWMLIRLRKLIITEIIVTRSLKKEVIVTEKSNYKKGEKKEEEIEEWCERNRKDPMKGNDMREMLKNILES